MKSQENIYVFEYNGNPFITLVNLGVSRSFLDDLITSIDKALNNVRKLEIGKVKITSLYPILIAYKKEKRARKFIAEGIPFDERSYILSWFDLETSTDVRAFVIPKSRYIFFDEKGYREYRINSITILHELTHMLFEHAGYPIQSVNVTALELYRQYVEKKYKAYLKDIAVICAMGTNLLLSHYLVYKFLINKIPRLRNNIKYDLYEHTYMFSTAVVENGRVDYFLKSILYYVIIRSLGLSESMLESILAHFKYTKHLNELSRILKKSEEVRDEEEYKNIWIEIFNALFNFLKDRVTVKK